MPNIDDLSISVKSNVTSATNSIDKLISKLGALSASLGQVNTSGFSAMASGIRQITSATSGMGTISSKDVAKTVRAINNFATIDAQNLNRVGSAIYSISNGISSINGLNANTEKINKLALSIRQFGFTTATQASNNIPKISKALTRLVLSMKLVGSLNVNTQGLSNILSAVSRLGGVKVNTAITQIPLITDALRKLMISLSEMNSLNINTAGLTQLVNAISRLGGKTVTQSISNIPKVTEAVMQMMATLSKAPQVSYNVIQLVNSMANLASQGSKVGIASNSLYNGFMRFGKGADYARKKSFSLASAIGKLYAKYFLLLRLFRGIGKGIGLASDLTEVENVVNASFGRFKNQEITLDYKINGEEYVTSIEKLGETSIQDFGMSELTAKQIASRFQAMGGAIGFSQDEMAKMSLTLTALTADMASFYNVEQEAVAEDLAAIMTGQTRPLRDYGLDLTQATLQEWALSQGMEANIATMTQAEKVLLRYNYVLAQTGMAQGDFARTQGTWANQIRILRQQFEALGAIIGQNFIYALKPVVTALNTVMAKLIQFARVVSNSLGKIFGWKYEDTTGGIADDLEFGAEAADDLGSGLGGAADKAKKLKQQLQGFDELNVLTTNTPSSGGGGGGGALGDTDVSTTGGQWVRDNTEKFFESDLDSLYKLGDYIGTTLTNQLRSIDWQSVYQGAKNFGSGLASFLNGLISPELFSATGATIAGALNTAIYSSLAFGETFEFEEFGLSIAEGINTFFRNTDFSALGKDIKAWVEGLRTTLVTIITEVDWGEILKGIGDVLKSLDIETIATLFGFGALSMLFKRGLFSTLGTTLGAVTTLPAVLISGLNGIGAKIKLGFVGGLTTAFVGFNIGEWIYEQITGDDTSDINYIDYFRGEGKASAEEWLNAFQSVFVGGLGPAFSTGLNKSVDYLSKSMDHLQKNTKSVNKVFGDTAKELKKTGNVFEQLSEDVPEYSEVIETKVTSRFRLLSDNATKSFEEMANFIKSKSDESSNDMSRAFSSANNIIKSTTSNTTSSMMSSFSNMANSVILGNNNMKNTINNNSNSIKSVSANTTNDIIERYKAMKNSNVNQVTSLKNTAVSLLSALKNDGIRETDGLNTNLKNKFEDAKRGAEGSFSSIHSIILRNMQNSKKTISDEDWYTPGTNLVAGLRNGIANKWSSTSGDGLVGKIVSLASGLTSALKRAFGIHSPSRLWRDDIGYYLAEGLRLGVVGEEGHIAKDIIAMGSRLTNTMSGALTLATPSSLSGNYDFGVTSTMAHSFSADTSMSSNIADGVRQGLANSQAEQNALLREQNELLMQILDKTGISSSDLFNAVRRESRQHYNQTGTSAFVY